MVDVLWREGQQDAAIRLEMLWNQLANTRKFSLLCGYSMGSFYKDAAFDAICHQHTHVLSIDGAAAPVRPPCRSRGLPDTASASVAAREPRAEAGRSPVVSPG